MAFINTDAKLKIGGRKAAQISRKALFDQILEAARLSSKNNPGYYDSLNQAVYNNMDEDNIMTQAVQALVNLDSRCIKDYKFKASAENVMCFEREGGLMGFHTLPNGLTFYGFYMGGDWEHPIFMILYHDGKNIRLYTPTCGNTINLDCKCALGSESEDMIPKLEAKYKKLGVWIPQDKHDNFENPLTSMYVAKYGISSDWTTSDDLDFEWNAIQRDIEARIEVFQPSNPITISTKAKKSNANGRCKFPIDEILAENPNMPDYLKEMFQAQSKNPNRWVYAKVYHRKYGELEFCYQDKEYVVIYQNQIGECHRIADIGNIVDTDGIIRYEIAV